MSPSTSPASRPEPDSGQLMRQTVAFVLVGMSFVIIAGGVALSIISPQFLATTREGLAGEGDAPLGWRR